MTKAFSLFVALLICAFPSTPASAIVVNSPDVVRLSFDLSGYSPPPPYQNINFQLIVNHLTDDLNHGEGFTIQAFDHNSLAVSNPITLRLRSDAGGGLESGFGGPQENFFGTLIQPTGFLLITNIVGSFDLTGARVLAGNLNFFPSGTPWINAIINVVNPVTLDVRPGSTENPINPMSAGIVPVAVLSSATFSAKTINWQSVRLGVTGTEAASTGFGFEDVNKDGQQDLLLHFPTQSTGIVCGTTSIKLTGQTYSGNQITGSDSIRTVGGSCK